MWEKMSAPASALLNFTLRTWCGSVPKVVEDSKKRRNGITYMSAFSVKLTENNECGKIRNRNNYSLHVQETVLYKQKNQG